MFLQSAAHPRVIGLAMVGTWKQDKLIIRKEIQFSTCHYLLKFGLGLLRK